MRLLRVSLISFTVAAVLLGLLVFLNACNSRHSAQRFYFAPGFPTERRADTIARIESESRGELPGVRFFIVPYPAQTPDGRKVTSYRVQGPQAFIVLSWKTNPFRVEDIHWECSHLIDGTDDTGNPLHWSF